MSDGARDPVAAAAARLEAAVERLAQAVARTHVEGEDGESVPRAEVAAMAERLDATIARLRGALSDELRGALSDELRGAEPHPDADEPD